MLSVQWRDGVHIAGTPLWCDARRVRDVCVASSAYTAEPLRHGQLIATAETLALLARADADQRPASELAVPYARPFTLGELRIELYRSGHGVGAASLSVERAGLRVIYAGAVNPAGGGLGEVADVRRGDALVVDATYGHPRYQFPEVEATIAELGAFCDRALAEGRTAVLLVGSPLKGLDVAARLAADARPLRAHRAIHHAAQRMRRLGHRLPPIKRWAHTLCTGELLLWPVDAPAPEGDAPTWRALVSGEAVDPARVSALACDTGFAWSNRADYPALLAYIDACGARDVYVTGRYREAVAAQLDAPGLHVTPLGPPRQLSLGIE